GLVGTVFVLAYADLSRRRKSEEQRFAAEGRSSDAALAGWRDERAGQRLLWQEEQEIRRKKQNRAVAARDRIAHILNQLIDTDRSRMAIHHRSRERFRERIEQLRIVYEHAKSLDGQRAT